MPDIWTHHLFAKTIKKQYKLPIKHKRNYYLGAQGPDLFYYLDFALVKRKDNLELGTRMHDELTREILEWVLARLPETQGRLKSYLYGFLTHYALDSITHPLIYQLAPTSKCHKKVEMMIDKIYHDRVLSTDIRKTSSFALVDVGERIPEEIVHFYQELSRDIFSVEAQEAMIQRSYRYFRRYLNLTSKETALKTGVVKGITSLFRLDLDYHLYPEKADSSVLKKEELAQFDRLFERARQYYGELLQGRLPDALPDFSGKLHNKAKPKALRTCPNT